MTKLLQNKGRGLSRGGTILAETTGINSCRVVLFLVIMSFSAVTVGAGQHIAGGKDHKPADPLYDHKGDVFDCTGDTTLTLSPGMNLTLFHTTEGRENNLNSYACRPWMEQGPEYIYELDVQQETEFYAGLSDLGETDLDLFVLSDCDTDSCLVGENQELSIVLSTGTYWLVVDGFGTAEPDPGSYTLNIDARWLGIPPQICVPDRVPPLDCNNQTYEKEIDLAVMPNLVQSYDCSPIVERGGEGWFEITVHAYNGFQATTTGLPPNLDLALWLFDGCGPEAQCLAFVDEVAGVGAETMIWLNNEGANVVVYLALDSTRPAEADQGDAVLEIVCSATDPTETESTSFGSLRSLYR